MRMEIRGDAKSEIYGGCMPGKLPKMPFVPTLAPIEMEMPRVFSLKTRGIEMESGKMDLFCD